MDDEKPPTHVSPSASEIAPIAVRLDAAINAPLSDVLSFVSGAVLGGVFVASLLMAVTWGMWLAGLATVLGGFLIGARRVHNSRVLTAVHQIVEEERGRLTSITAGSSRLAPAPPVDNELESGDAGSADFVRRASEKLRGIQVAFPDPSVIPTSNLTPRDIYVEARAAEERPFEHEEALLRCVGLKVTWKCSLQYASPRGDDAFELGLRDATAYSTPDSQHGFNILPVTIATVIETARHPGIQRLRKGDQLTVTGLIANVVAPYRGIMLIGLEIEFPIVPTTRQTDHT